MHWWVVVPVGTADSVLKLHKNIIASNILGVGTEIISVLDGDVVESMQQKPTFSSLNILGLPFPSIEKYLFEILYKGNDLKLKKQFGDKYFQLKSIDILISEYNHANDKANNKSFYSHLLHDLEQRNITEDAFNYVFM